MVATTNRAVFEDSKTNYDWSWSDTNDLVGVGLQSDNVNNEKGVAGVLIISSTAIGAGFDTITVKAQMGLDFNGTTRWGPVKTMQDEDGNNLTFTTEAATSVYANIYIQPWWMPCNKFRIVLSGNSGDSLTGQAGVILR